MKPLLKLAWLATVLAVVPLGAISCNLLLGLQSPECDATSCVPMGPCQTASCVEDVCERKSRDPGFLVDGGDGGPCMETRCDGEEDLETVPSAPGKACAHEAGAGVCNDAGSCVQCNTGADCLEAGRTCQQGQCQPPACSKPTDTACGGDCLTKCADGQMCMVGGDCQSARCLAGTCCKRITCEQLGYQCGTLSDDGCGQPLLCDDQVMNGTETSIDCGGKLDGGAVTCPRCPLGRSCNVGGDCSSGFCVNSFCCDTPCTSPCETCGASGVCTNLPISSIGQCTQPAWACDGSGACKIKNGYSCSAYPNKCLSTYCSAGKCIP